MQRIDFAIAGSGWRAEFYLRVARACPERFAVTGVVARSRESRERIADQWGVQTFDSAEALLDRTKPRFVVTAVKKTSNREVIESLSGMGVPVLCETPPAMDVEGLKALNALDARIQVAEQYVFQPHHAARLAVARSGRIGSVSHAQVSAAHGYHGISLIRRLLGLSYEPCSITGRSFTAPLIAGPGRSGPPLKEECRPSSQQVFWLDFGDKFGIYDFSGDQYFSWIRNDRILVRGERGEIVNKEVVFLKDFLTPIKLDFVRHETGADGNLEGRYLRGIQLGEEWVYRNPFTQGALMDDEIAVASCLAGMAEYLDTGQAFYSLAEASQDQYLALCCEKALETGKTVKTDSMPWRSRPQPPASGENL